METLEQMGYREQDGCATCEYRDGSSCLRQGPALFELIEPHGICMKFERKSNG